MRNPSIQPKILLLDIETSYLEVKTWGIRDQFIDLADIKKDWSILAWCAKWLDEPKLFYEDNRKARNKRNDKKLLKGIWKLLDEADVIITQNGRFFDIPKLKARFAINGFKPFSSFRHIDTYLMGKKFGFTSHKLAYMLDALGCKVKKSKHKKFPGRELWDECLAGNIEAWKEMEAYNKMDVLGLEELYKKLRPWDSSINFSSITGVPAHVQCACGSRDLMKHGFRFTNGGRYQRYQCNECGSEVSDKKNLLKQPKQGRPNVKR